MNFSRDMLRLYAVTDRSWLRGHTLLEQVEAALDGGATLVQLREKELDAPAFLHEAIEMTKLCHRYGVPLLINDDVDIALRSGADGVHVGQSDMEAGAVRRRLGSEMIIGVTAKTVAQALRAQDAGADYLGSGAVFGTTTKHNALPMSLDQLRDICSAVSIPVVAIGGINRGNMLNLRGSGVCGAAVVSGIFAAGDIRQECRILRGMADQIIGK